MRQIILDTETTGLDPKEGHRIIEFAALEMIDRKLTGNYLQLYINPERKIDEGASRIHGITDDMVADKPVFRDVVSNIRDFIADSELIIHNAKFDLGFLDYQFKLLDLSVTSSIVVNVIDTLILARQKFPGAKSSLDALCDRFCVDRSSRNYHGALIDCELLTHVYLALTREQMSIVLDDVIENHKNATKVEFKKFDTSGMNLKVNFAKSEDIVQHELYLNSLNNGN